MDIHPPAEPVHSVKDFFIHLSMIVISILLALSLEQLVESRHHKALAQEAKANITSEIRDNKAELDKSLASYGETEANLRKVFDVAKKLRAHEKLTDISVSLGMTISQLSSASRGSAEATGALAFMEYAEVKKLVGVYDVQQEYLRLQDRLLDTLTLTLGALKRDPSKLSDREVDGLTANAESALANLFIVQNLGQALTKEYDRAISH